MRSPYVAGQFYSGSRDGLRQQIEECFLSNIGPGELPESGDAKRDIIGCVVPHAGYMYSGGVAAHVYGELAGQETPETVFILSPNHTGAGSLVSLSNEDWETPLGVVKTDKEVVESLFRDCKSIDLDERAHEEEHSLEVQLPFLQYIYDDFKIVPICMMWPSFEVLEEIAQCLSKLGKNALFIASSDFTHRKTHEFAIQMDSKAIKQILSLDERRFLQTVYEHNISSCGHYPIATCIATTKKLGATDAKLLKYATSGDASGDYSQVVGYAGIVMRR
jgi:AmmeMemoRadiSam system protein B